MGGERERSGRRKERRKGGRKGRRGGREGEERDGVKKKGRKERRDGEIERKERNGEIRKRKGRERRRGERGRGGRKRGRGEVHCFRSTTTSTPFLVNKECRPSFLTQEEMQTGDGCTCRRRLRITIHRQWGRQLRKLQVKEDT